MNEKKYIINHMELMKDWNWSKNSNLNPQTLSLGSNKNVWWVCSKGHEWQDTISHRTEGRNCPYCSNHRLLKGYNDLASRYPHLLNEWNYSKNENMKPESIFPFSNKKVWWICSKGHEWQDTPNHRITRNNGCPYCSNHRVLSGFNDLKTTHPELINEWNYEKNGMLKPSDVMHGSQQKVWWICQRNHEWQSTINSRTNGVGCPFCKKELHTSFPEQTIYFYLKKVFPDAINRYVLNKKELDIFIPSINVGIEYDGRMFHNEKTKHKEINKDDFFAQKGITVYRIKEKKYVKSVFLEENVIYYSPNHMYKNLTEPLNLLINVIFTSIGKEIPNLKISLNDDYQEILKSFLSTLKYNSISNNSLLMNEWNYNKNKNLNPEYLSEGSGYKVWWKCEQGHEWQATINSRKKGNKCPYCSNQRLLEGYNDLSTTHPHLAAEWHPTKNGELKPNQVIAGTNKKVWWLGKCGHEWIAVISSRKKGVGCPYCTNQKPIPGENDLLTLNPSLAKEWHPTKNNELKPNMVHCGSGKKVWWICEKGHEWQAVVRNRTNGTGCPYCFGSKSKIKKQ